MGDCCTRPSPSQETLSDSSESSTKVFPPTRRNTPAPSALTQGRLSQVVMSRSYSCRDVDVASGTNRRVDPLADDLLTRHFRFDSHGTLGGSGEGLNEELAELGRQADESRVARVRTAMEKQDRAPPSTTVRHGSRPAEPISYYHPYTPPPTVGDANSTGYYQPSVAAAQQSEPESVARVVYPKSSSNRRPQERPHRRRDTPSRQYEGSSYGRQ